MFGSGFWSLALYIWGDVATTM